MSDVHKAKFLKQFVRTKKKRNIFIDANMFGNCFMIKKFPWTMDKQRIFSILNYVL